MLFRDERWADGTPCWVDLMVPDRAKAVEFYQGLLGWQVEVGGADTGFYGMAAVAGRPVAGVGEIPPGQEGMPAVWTTYLAVSDVDKTVAAVTEAGGTVLSPPMDVMSAGRMAIAQDPAGAVFGLWQSGEHYGTQVLDAPGAPAWNECMSRDFAAAKSFYGDVFGYGFGDLSSGGFVYATLDLSGRPVGGLGQLPAEVPAEVPSSWLTYFWVADADASAARITELGGQIVEPPADTPHGRLVTAMDNQGVSFRVMAPNEQSGKPAGWED
jgi:uncharacterized protein